MCRGDCNEQIWTGGSIGDIAMSTRVKGGMYCPRCKRPVAAERSGHAVRNTLGAAATFGLSLKSERWHCPICGGPVEREAFRRVRVAVAPPTPAEGQVAVTLTHAGVKLIPVLKAYRQATRAGLREAKSAIENTPVLMGYFDPDTAAALVDELERSGATAHLGDIAPESPDVAAQLVTLADLHRSGALTDSEFALAKERALANAAKP